MTFGDTLQVKCSHKGCETEVAVPLQPPNNADEPWSATELQDYMSRHAGRVKLDPQFGERRKIRIFCLKH